MALSNAERQKRFRERLKEKASRNGELGALAVLRNAIEAEAGDDVRPALASLTLALSDAVRAATAGQLSDDARARVLAVMAAELHGHHAPSMGPALRAAEVERMTVAELSAALATLGRPVPKKPKKAELVALVLEAEKGEAGDER